MVGHQAVREDSERVPVMGFTRDPLKCLKAGVPAERHHSYHRAMKRVVDQAAGGNAGLTGHALVAGSFAITSRQN